MVGKTASKKSGKGKGASKKSTTAGAAKHYLQRAHGTFMFGSVAAILFGIFALIAPATILPTFVWIAAVALIFIGLMEVVTAFANMANRGWKVHLLLGLIEAVVGIVLACNTAAGVELLMSIVGVFILIRGIVDIVVGAKFRVHQTDKILWILSGFVGLALGALVLWNPWASSTAFMILLGAYALVFGFLGLLYALRVRKAVRAK